mgnify:FL=1
MDLYGQSVLDAHDIDVGQTTKHYVGHLALERLELLVPDELLNMREIIFIFIFDMIQNPTRILQHTNLLRGLIAL